MIDQGFLSIFFAFLDGFVAFHSRWVVQTRQVGRHFVIVNEDKKDPSGCLGHKHSHASTLEIERASLLYLFTLTYHIYFKIGKIALNKGQRSVWKMNIINGTKIYF